MTRTIAAIGFAVSLVATTACDADEPGVDDPTGQPERSDPSGPIVRSFDFDGGSDGWSSDVSDFTADTRPREFVSETGVGPPDMDHMATDFFHLGSDNPADDVFVYLRRQFDEGLDAGADYDVALTVVFASAAPTGCAGIGGAPGESVWVKGGATTDEPIPIDDGGRIELSADKGNQSSAGDDAVVLGVVANGIECDEALARDAPPFALVALSGTVPGSVTADDDGSLWVFVGADSGFEGRTDLYYDAITVEFIPVG